MVPTIAGGTILWFVLFLVQLPFYRWFDDRGTLGGLWTCLAGAGLGLIGIWYVRGRDAALGCPRGTPATRAHCAAAGQPRAQHSSPSSGTTRSSPPRPRPGRRDVTHSALGCTSPLAEQEAGICHFHSWSSTDSGCAASTA
ncbi:hypothetical protein SANTM175S_01497 [Streptomyces antimycoticus]